MLKAAIFDLDGVVVNTVPLHFNAWKRMFNEYGHDFTFEDYKDKVDGIPRIDGAKAILTELSHEEVVKAGNKKQGYFLENLEKSEIPVFETTVVLMGALQKEGIPVAVISSSKNCIPILKKIRLFDRLDAVVDGHAITKGKPDPQVFLMAADKLKVKPAESVVFEDAVLGVEAAKNGKMACVGIDRYGKPERLAKADIVVQDLGEVDVPKLKSLVP